MRKTNIDQLLKANLPQGVRELERLPFNYWRYNINDVSLYNDNIETQAL